MGFIIKASPPLPYIKSLLSYHQSPDFLSNYRVKDYNLTLRKRTRCVMIMCDLVFTN